MKGKRLWLVGGVITLAAVLIILGLQRVYLVYQHYRADILANESSHLERQLDMLTTRMEFAAAEANYAQSGDPSIMRSLMARRDILRFDQPYSLAVWDDGALLGTSDAGFPYQNQTDEPLGVLCSIRQDDLGRFWFIFTKERDSGLRYEMAVQVFTLFSDQAASVRIGNEGMLFMMDSRFLASSHFTAMNISFTPSTTFAVRASAATASANSKEPANSYFAIAIRLIFLQASAV